MRGGHDIELLDLGDGERLEEAGFRQIQALYTSLPTVKAGDGLARQRSATDQVGRLLITHSAGRNLATRLLQLQLVADFLFGRELRDEIKLPDYGFRRKGGDNGAS